MDHGLVAGDEVEGFAMKIAAPRKRDLFRGEVVRPDGCKTRAPQTVVDGECIFFHACSCFV